MKLRGRLDAWRPLSSWRSVPGARPPAAHPELGWRGMEGRQQRPAAGFGARPAGLWRQVGAVGQQPSIKPELGKGCRGRFRQRCRCPTGGAPRSGRRRSTCMSLPWVGFTTHTGAPLGTAGADRTNTSLGGGSGRGSGSVKVLLLFVRGGRGGGRIFGEGFA